MYAYTYGGDRYDVGEKLGFIQATLEFALDRPELRSAVIDLMEAIAERAKVNS